MNDKKTEFARHLRTAVCLVLVGLYILGIVAMMTFSFRAGLVLWVVSTLGGLGLLYWVHTVERRAASDGGEAGAPEPPTGGDGAPEASEDPCE